ncbi:hypothetical protein EVG20_g6501 [Dentipellis fragilis]|uniref:Uncharacterized protein n=1 Tax=Dentipellis fragilis TaxID=205917 RepID=A0A4Y9YKE3_9AGAM|nr:hypothetical protein EVG20_g6501 [Dentipellis fragilis]
MLPFFPAIVPQEHRQLQKQQDLPFSGRPLVFVSSLLLALLSSQSDALSDLSQGLTPACFITAGCCSPGRQILPPGSRPYSELHRRLRTNSFTSLPGVVSLITNLVMEQTDYYRAQPKQPLARPAPRYHGRNANAAGPPLSIYMPYPSPATGPTDLQGTSTSENFGSTFPTPAPLDLPRNSANDEASPGTAPPPVQNPLPFSEDLRMQIKHLAHALQNLNIHIQSGVIQGAVVASRPTPQTSEDVVPAPSNDGLHSRPERSGWPTVEDGQTTGQVMHLADVSAPTIASPTNQPWIRSQPLLIDAERRPTPHDSNPNNMDEESERLMHDMHENPQNRTIECNEDPNADDASGRSPTVSCVSLEHAPSVVSPSIGSILPLPIVQQPETVYDTPMASSSNVLPHKVGDIWPAPTNVCAYSATVPALFEYDFDDDDNNNDAAAAAEPSATSKGKQPMREGEAFPGVEVPIVDKSNQTSSKHASSHPAEHHKAGRYIRLPDDDAFGEIRGTWSMCPPGPFLKLRGEFLFIGLPEPLDGKISFSQDGYVESPESVSPTTDVTQKQSPGAAVHWEKENINPRPGTDKLSSKPAHGSVQITLDTAHQSPQESSDVSVANGIIVAEQALRPTQAQDKLTPFTPFLKRAPQPKPVADAKLPTREVTSMLFPDPSPEAALPVHDSPSEAAEQPLGANEDSRLPYPSPHPISRPPSRPRPQSAPAASSLQRNTPSAQPAGLQRASDEDIRVCGWRGSLNPSPIRSLDDDLDEISELSTLSTFDDEQREQIYDERVARRERVVTCASAVKRCLKSAERLSLDTADVERPLMQLLNPLQELSRTIFVLRKEPQSYISELERKWSETQHDYLFAVDRNISKIHALCEVLSGAIHGGGLTPSSYVAQISSKLSQFAFKMQDLFLNLCASDLFLAEIDYRHALRTLQHDIRQRRHDIFPRPENWKEIALRDEGLRDYYKGLIREARNSIQGYQQAKRENFDESQEALMASSSAAFNQRPGN